MAAQLAEERARLAGRDEDERRPDRSGRQDDVGVLARERRATDRRLLEDARALRLGGAGQAERGAHRIVDGGVAEAKRPTESVPSSACAAAGVSQGATIDALAPRRLFLAQRRGVIGVRALMTSDVAVEIALGRAASAARRRTRGALRCASFQATRATRRPAAASTLRNEASGSGTMAPSAPAVDPSARRPASSRDDLQAARREHVRRRRAGQSAADDDDVGGGLIP